MPRFTIVIPAYNAERYVEQCVRSVLMQTYRDLEVIVVDDGSTDRTPGILQVLASEDDRMTIVRRNNGGVARARNAAVERATGEYVLFVDADDYWNDVDALEGLAALTDSRRPDVVVWGHRRLYVRTGRLDAPPAPLGDDLPEDKAELLDVLLRTGRYGPALWKKAIRRDLFTAHDLAFLSGTRSDDLEWSARLARYAATIAHYDKPFYVYRVLKASLGKSFSEQYFQDRTAHFIACREHAMAVDDEALRDVLLAYAAERYVEVLTTIGVSAHAHRHLRTLRTHVDVLASAATPRVRMVARAQRILGLRPTVHALRLKQIAWNCIRL